METNIAYQILRVSGLMSWLEAAPVVGGCTLEEARQVWRGGCRGGTRPGLPPPPCARLGCRTCRLPCPLGLVRGRALLAPLGKQTRSCSACPAPPHRVNEPGSGRRGAGERRTPLLRRGATGRRLPRSRQEMLLPMAGRAGGRSASRLALLRSHGPHIEPHSAPLLPPPLCPAAGAKRRAEYSVPEHARFAAGARHCWPGPLLTRPAADPARC